MTEAASAAWRAAIRAKLDAIAREEDVTVLLAIESGSRAWGFHSTDSDYDYDVRFIYSRPVDRHLRVYPGRDVIERPVSEDLDPSGWDVSKTLGLSLGSNAVALEWLQSPITYVDVPDFRQALTAFAQAALQRTPVQWRYRRLAERQMERSHNPDGSLRLKRCFYLIRPVLALRWLRLNPGLATPPMDMGTLMAECDLSSTLQHSIPDLTERGDIHATPAETDALIEAELAHAIIELQAETEPSHVDLTTAADALLTYWIKRCDPQPRGARP